MICSRPGTHIQCICVDHTIFLFIRRCWVRLRRCAAAAAFINPCNIFGGNITGCLTAVDFTFNLIPGTGLSDNFHLVILANQANGTMVRSCPGTHIQRIRIDNAFACRRCRFTRWIIAARCLGNILGINIAFLGISINRAANLIPWTFTCKNLHWFILADNAQNRIGGTCSAAHI